MVLKKRLPEYPRLYTYFLSEGLIFLYQLARHIINKYMYLQWQRKALYPLNAIAINVYLCISLHIYKILTYPIHILAQEPLPRGSINLQFLVDFSLVIIIAYLICLIHVQE